MPSGHPVINLIMDSGAFSAYRLGIEIDIKDYGRFVRDNSQHFEAVCLDHIFPEDTEVSASKSFDNFKQLWDMGAKTMPVFHYGERIEWLDKMLEAGADYIGLSSSMTSLA